MIDPIKLFFACSRASLYNEGVELETANPVSVSSWWNPSCRDGTMKKFS